MTTLPTLDGRSELEEKRPLSDFDAVIVQKQGRYRATLEVAKLAVFLASERAAFSSGSGFVLDGGGRASVL